MSNYASFFDVLFTSFQFLYLFSFSFFFFFSFLLLSDVLLFITIQLLHQVCCLTSILFQPCSSGCFEGGALFEMPGDEGQGNGLSKVHETEES